MMKTKETRNITIMMHKKYAMSFELKCSTQPTLNAKIKQTLARNHAMRWFVECSPMISTFDKEN